MVPISTTLLVYSFISITFYHVIFANLYHVINPNAMIDDYTIICFNKKKEGCRTDPARKFHDP
jgi:hypothetical protein